jgi:hypothetical protein
VRLGAELIEGIRMAPGEWTVEPLGTAPYAGPAAAPAP